MTSARPDDLYFKLFRVNPGKGDLRRLEIIHAAIRCIARDGYPGSNFDAIAAELKTRRSHIVYYFKAREDLLEHMARYISGVAAEVTAERMAKAKGPEEKLLAVADGAFAWAKRYPEQASVMLLFYFLSTHSKAFRALNSEIREAGFRRLKALLGELGHAKAKRLEAVTKGLQGSLTGLLLEQTIVSNAERHNYAALARAAWRALLGTL